MLHNHGYKRYAAIIFTTRESVHRFLFKIKTVDRPTGEIIKCPAQTQKMKKYVFLLTSHIAMMFRVELKESSCLASFTLLTPYVNTLLAEKHNWLPKEQRVLYNLLSFADT